MKTKIYFTIILTFVLAFSQLYSQSNPADGLKEIPLTGLSTVDGYNFHFYSLDGKLNIGYSEVFIALTDKDNNFVQDFTVRNFYPLMDMGMSKHCTPVGKVEKVAGKALYKTWFSFLMYTGQMGGAWSLGFNYTIGSTIPKSLIGRLTTNKFNVITSSTILNDTITQIGWFKDRHCTGSITLPLASSCGIGCGTGAGNMAMCWNGGLGMFLYNATESGSITKEVARSDAHFLLFDAQSKELVRAFLISLPSDASGKISVKVTGYRVANGISSNKTESIIPELIPDSVDHYLNAFHVISIEGVVIENQAKSYPGFATKSFKLTPGDLAPTNLLAVNNSGGTTIKFTPPANAHKAISNLTGYKVQVYNKAGVMQDQFTTISNDTTVNYVNVTGFKASQEYTFTVSALYPASAVEVESGYSTVVENSITGIILPVDNSPANNKWLQSFSYNSVYYYMSVVNPKSIIAGSQTVKAYINKRNDLLQPFPVMNDGFKIVATPFMRSMGHSSDGNTDLIWNATDSVYEGTLNFSMDGDWRVNLKVYDAVTTSLVAGTDMDAEGNGSTLYWDFYLDSTLTGMTEINSNGISVYPTLSNGEITIVSPAEARIKVIDLIGNTIESFQSSGSKTVDLNVQSGLYFISVESSGKTFIQKVIIRK